VGAKPEVTRNESEGNRNKERKRTTQIECPQEVDQQVWTDWLALRKEKKAPVTLTVVKSAKEEAVKAEMTLNEFLSVWCIRGSQGLQADWLKTKQGHQENKQEALERRNQEVARRWISKQELYAGAAAVIFDGADHV
jgi:hypothetical protein